jgi:hypothetical protein
VANAEPGVQLPLMLTVLDTQVTVARQGARRRNCWSRSGFLHWQQRPGMPSESSAADTAVHRL